MSDNSWIFDIENKVFSIIQYKVKKAIGTKYTKLNFTTTNINSSTVLPTVYIHMLSGNEVGQDLEHTIISGVNTTIQVEVFSNKSQSEARDIMKSVNDAMKSIGFTATMPYFENETTIYRMLMRFSRVIGAGDTL